jgi:anti-anti-sigma factor
LPAFTAVTGFAGTVLAEISCYTEPPATEHSSSSEAPLVVVDVAGGLDADTAPELHTRLNQAIRRNPRVCCDLSRSEFLGAAAVHTILAALREADDAGCVFTVRGVHGLGARVFQITGLDAVLASRARTGI